MKILKMTMVFAIVSVGFLSLINDNKEPQIGLNIGNKAPEIKTTLINGTYFNLADAKGKMIVVDFWASYDANERNQNHVKSSLISQYKDKEFKNGKGLEIVSISLDRFKTPLNRAIKADQMSYSNHICDFKGKQSQIVENYKAQTFKKYLIDGNGRIVAIANSMGEINIALERLANIKTTL